MPALTDSAAAVSKSGEYLCDVTRFFIAPASVQIIPSWPHCSRVIFCSTGLTVIGTPFTALYAAMYAREPPSVMPMRKGNDPKYSQGGIVIRSPNADIGRDPRWGRNEECYGEDAYFNGTMVVAFSKGLQGNDPKYWQSAALMKHFLANSKENDRDKSSSNFDERLFHEYYSLPFHMGVTEGGSRAYMAAYNGMNK